MSFRTDHLRYFVTVAEEGQITRAAKKLYLAQPALSQAISQLEGELGLQLLERHARGVRLTASGEAFLEKARAVVETEQVVMTTAQSLARAAQGLLELGFVGPPPPMTLPELLGALAAAQPKVKISFRDLPFPRGSTHSWLEAVDVAVCHPPAHEEGIRTQVLRTEPRALVARASHPLAALADASAEQVLDETFVSYHPDVQEGWAGFHSLDDRRGGPPAATTEDRVASSLEMLSALAMTEAVTTLPLTDANVVCQALPQLVAIPLTDAAPATISLVWATEHAHPLVGVLAELAARPSEG
jgi:DNA-binding transcriptional LysR family regulator